MLWKVLQAALKFKDVKQLFGMMAETVTLGDAHCFQMHCLSLDSVASVKLPGIVNQYFPGMNQRKIDKMREKTINSTEVAEEFAKNGCDEATLLMRRQKLERSLTVFDKDDDKLGTIHEDSCVRQEIRVASTSTGRTASCFPNCQNIPKDDKSTIRESFTSRHGARGVVIEVDFKQLEIAVLGLLSQDQRMIHDLDTGLDFHLQRVTVIRNRSYEELVAKYKEGDKEVKAFRQKAKTVSFQRMYGAGAASIQQSTGLDMEAVKAMIATEELTYPGVPALHRLTRYVCLRRGNPGTGSHYMYELPTGARVALKANDVNHMMPPVKNYPIQSYGAELVSIALAKIFREFVLEDRFAGKACVINFVHDSVWLDCHEDVAQDACDLISGIMSSLRDVLQKEFPGAPCNVNFGVSASIGRNLYDTYSPQQWFASQKALKLQQEVSAGKIPAVIAHASKGTAARSKMSSDSPSRSSARSSSTTSKNSKTSNVATPLRKSSAKRTSSGNGVQNILKKKLA